MAELFDGPSGYSYPKWKPEFYPRQLAAEKYLEHYATRLDGVEINYPFRLRKADYTPEDRRKIFARVKEIMGDGKNVFLFYKHEDTPAGALSAEEKLSGE